MTGSRGFLFNVFGIVLLVVISTTGLQSIADVADRPLGEVNFPVSCAPKVQESFNQAVALLHHMMYQQAEAEFQTIAEQDQDCAMAYWGIAMTQFHPLWAPPSKIELEKGELAITKAEQLQPQTQREQAYIAAAKAFYQDWPTLDHATRIAAWEAEQQKVMTANPDDIDAGAFYALALLASAPKIDKTFSQQQMAGSLLESLHEQAPQHPALFHYTIHAYDNPLLAERAVAVANGYDKLAPDVPHALHMPSHIFVRLGMWPQAIDWNHGRSQIVVSVIERSSN